MNLFAKLQTQAAEGRPVRVGLIGAGKFGSMFLSQVPTTPGLEVTTIADLATQRAQAAMVEVGWDEAGIAEIDLVTDGAELAERDDVDVIIDATGHPEAGIQHARAAIAGGKHIIMVNVEADVLAGPLLAAEARQAGVVYSMAYGDQPALTAELIDWARACGFRVIAAGKGTKYLPGYHRITPATVWDHYGLTADQARAAGMNSQMFTSFVDGTKSAIEMAAIANACDLTAPKSGLAFPPCGVDDLSHVLRPSADGGVLEGKGMVEVVSSAERDGRPVFRDLRWGVYVVVEAPNDYAAACFKQYGLTTDSTGRYAALYRPCHLIGLELGVSVLSAALRGEATGSACAFNGDVMATAKRDLATGDVLDGEGGTCVYGKLAPAAASLAADALPIGLAHGIELKTPVAAGQTVTWADVEIDPDRPAVQARRQMEDRFRPA
ncbi:MAG: SAF domain-containing protein [Paracoccaceae bacterium]|nr:SAF domain-containing protein [Paracoccaceae bacterium]